MHVINVHFSTIIGQKYLRVAV